MTQPVITFAIPFYSGLEYLEKAIASVLAQTDDAWHCVVCDDSDGAGVEAVVERAGRDRVVYSKNATNLGMSANFNRCLEIAETDHVTVLHADDELEPSYVATFRAAFAIHPRAVAFFCPVQIIGPDSQPRFSLADTVKRYLMPLAKHGVVLAGEPGLRTLLTANVIPAPTLCFSKAVLGARRFPLGVRFIMDVELTTQLLLDGEEIVGVPDRCYRYRRHDENQTELLTRTQHRYREESEFLDRMAVTATERGWHRSAAVARRKAVLKLNIGYRALKSAVMLQLGDAVRRLKLLREV